MSLNLDSPDEESSIPLLYFNMQDSSLILTDDIAHDIFNNGYFGQWTSKNTLVLEPEEILLLIDRKRISLVHFTTNQKITSAELVAHFTRINKFFWSRYLVYKDLRNRGYVVRIGTKVTAPFRIYSRGGKPGESISKKVIFPLSEGEDLDLDFLDQLVNQSKIDRKTLLLSVVDRLGDVTYYQASQLELEHNELEYEYRDELPQITPENKEED
ncbi:MAG: tRNA-intron lyase [Promethearchaeota archaeon]